MYGMQSLPNRKNLSVILIRRCFEYFEWILSQLSKEVFFEKANQVLLDVVVKYYLN